MATSPRGGSAHEKTRVGGSDRPRLRGGRGPRRGASRHGGREEGPRVSEGASPGRGPRLRRSSQASGRGHRSRARADQAGARDGREEGAEGRAQGAAARAQGRANGAQARKPEGERAAHGAALGRVWLAAGAPLAAVLLVAVGTGGGDHEMLAVERELKIAKDHLQAAAPRTRGAGSWRSSTSTGPRRRSA